MLHHSPAGTGAPWSELKWPMPQLRAGMRRARESAWRRPSQLTGGIPGPADKLQCSCPGSMPTVFSPSSTHFRTRTPLPQEGRPRAGLVQGEDPLHAALPAGFSLLARTATRAHSPCPSCHPPALRLAEGCPVRSRKGHMPGFESLAAADRRGCVSGWSSLTVTLQDCQSI